jgi:hypothetical protein
MVDYIATDWPDADLAGWEGPGWYFWTEDQATCIGPFATAAEAEAAAKEYAETL